MRAAAAGARPHTRIQVCLHDRPVTGLSRLPMGLKVPPDCCYSALAPSSSLRFGGRKTNCVRNVFAGQQADRLPEHDFPDCRAHHRSGEMSGEVRSPSAPGLEHVRVHDLPPRELGKTNVQCAASKRCRKQIEQVHSPRALGQIVLFFSPDSWSVSKRRYWRRSLPVTTRGWRRAIPASLPQILLSPDA